MLCKHEVVGSIPSVSTRFNEGLARVVRDGPCGREALGPDECTSLQRALLRPFAGPCSSAPISDIVKRECGLWAGESRTSWVMFGKQGGGFREGPVTGLFVTVLRCASATAVAHRRTSITRAIKCLKSIRWMPWR